MKETDERREVAKWRCGGLSTESGVRLVLFEVRERERVQKRARAEIGRSVGASEK